jgi:hypothetical protein
MIFRRIRYYINKFIDWCYFGKITCKVISWDGGCESEIEFRGRNNEVVGYWAYGYYDPYMPYPRGLQRPTSNST